eukprot:Clim_evm13s247 gene=Clim_evmTU13s247
MSFSGFGAGSNAGKAPTRGGFSGGRGGGRGGGNQPSFGSQSGGFGGSAGPSFGSGFPSSGGGVGGGRGRGSGSRGRGRGRGGGQQQRQPQQQQQGGFGFGAGSGSGFPPAKQQQPTFGSQAQPSFGGTAGPSFGSGFPSGNTGRGGSNRGGSNRGGSRGRGTRGGRGGGSQPAFGGSSAFPSNNAPNFGAGMQKPAPFGGTTPAATPFGGSGLQQGSQPNFGSFGAGSQPRQQQQQQPTKAKRTRTPRQAHAQQSQAAGFGGFGQASKPQQPKPQQSTAFSGFGAGAQPMTAQGGGIFGAQSGTQQTMQGQQQMQQKKKGKKEKAERKPKKDRKKRTRITPVKDAEMGEADTGDDEEPEEGEEEEEDEATAGGGGSLAARLGGRVTAQAEDEEDHEEETDEEDEEEEDDEGAEDDAAPSGGSSLFSRLGARETEAATEKKIASKTLRVGAKEFVPSTKAKKAAPAAPSTVGLKSTYKAGLLKEVPALRTEPQLSIEAEYLTEDKAEARFKVLDEMDSVIRKRNPDAKLIGTCLDMCPEKERMKRQWQRDLSQFEMVEGTEHAHPFVCIKKFSRSAAGQETSLPHELRTLPSLRNSISYLLHYVLPKMVNEESLDAYNFLTDRFRAIRQDIVKQRLGGEEGAALSAIIVRFHIHAFHIFGGNAHFDAKANKARFTDALTAVDQACKDYRAKTNNFLPEESEMRGYKILMGLDDQSALRDVAIVHPTVLHTAEVQFAIAAYNAFLDNNYVRFFRMALQDANYLQFCLMHSHFNAMRLKALPVLENAYFKLQLDSKALERDLGLPGDTDKVQIWLQSIGMSGAYDEKGFTVTCTGHTIDPELHLPRFPLYERVPSTLAELLYGQGTLVPDWVPVAFSWFSSVSTPATTENLLKRPRPLVGTGDLGTTGIVGTAGLEMRQKAMREAQERKIRETEEQQRARQQALEALIPETTEKLVDEVADAEMRSVAADVLEVIKEFPRQYAASIVHETLHEQIVDIAQHFISEGHSIRSVVDSVVAEVLKAEVNKVSREELAVHNAEYHAILECCDDLVDDVLDAEIANVCQKELSWWMAIHYGSEDMADMIIEEYLQETLAMAADQAAFNETQLLGRSFKDSAMQWQEAYPSDILGRLASRLPYDSFGHGCSPVVLGYVPQPTSGYSYPLQCPAFMYLMTYLIPPVLLADLSSKAAASVLTESTFLHVPISSPCKATPDEQKEIRFLLQRSANLSEEFTHWDVSKNGTGTVSVSARPKHTMIPLPMIVDLRTVDEVIAYILSQVEAIFTPWQNEPETERTLLVYLLGFVGHECDDSRNCFNCAELEDAICSAIEEQHGDSVLVYIHSPDEEVSTNFFMPMSWLDGHSAEHRTCLHTKMISYTNAVIDGLARDHRARKWVSMDTLVRCSYGEVLNRIRQMGIRGILMEQSNDTWENANGLHHGLMHFLEDEFRTDQDYFHLCMPDAGLWSDGGASTEYDAAAVKASALNLIQNMLQVPIARDVRHVVHALDLHYQYSLEQATLWSSSSVYHRVYFDSVLFLEHLKQRELLWDNLQAMVPPAVLPMKRTRIQDDSDILVKTALSPIAQPNFGASPVKMRRPDPEPSPPVVDLGGDEDDVLVVLDSGDAQEEQAEQAGTAEETADNDPELTKLREALQKSLLQAREDGAQFRRDLDEAAMPVQKSAAVTTAASAASSSRGGGFFSDMMRKIRKVLH